VTNILRSGRRGSVAVLLGLLLCSMSKGTAAAPAKPVTHTVKIDAMQFKPAVLTVRQGDIVVWTNNDPFPHTVTSGPGGFDSKQILPGKSWKYTAAKKGERPYACTLHPTMKATLTVQ
jgi:plastocyanin